MLKVLKICGNTWENASRDKRELSVYEEMGCTVAVLAKGDAEDCGREDELNGFKVYRYSTRPLGSKFPNAFNRVASLFAWSRFAKKLKPDIISAHDLMPGLVIAWLSTFFVRKKPYIIYDSHEFEIERNTEGKRGKIQKKFIIGLEKFLMKKCVFSIMVNDTIADEVMRIHKLKQRPVVIRSTPNKWNIDESECKRVREEIMTSVQGPDYLVMYHGALVPDRGIEELIRLLGVNNNLSAVVLGNGSAEYIERIRNTAMTEGVDARLYIHPAVPISELWKYVGAVDVCLMMIQGTSKSYYYSLPNKFFESIQSLTPMVASDFPEMKRIIDKYEIGLTTNPGDIEAMNQCVERMRTDKEFYDKCRNNLLKAKDDLCWENEKEVLKQAFEQYILQGRQKA